MPARLVGISGPLEGVEYPLTGDEVVVGRDPNCGLSIDDQALSRKHCRIYCDGGQYVLEDLGSSNGVLVNGAAMQSRQLANGDRVAVGRSALLFLTTPSDGRDRTPALVWAEGELGSTTASMPLSQVPGVETLLSPQQASAPDSDDLITLLNLSSSLASMQSVGSLASELLESTLKLTAGDWAALICLHQSFSSLGIHVAFAHESVEQQQPVLSRSAVTRATEERQAILWADCDEQFAPVPAKSLLQSGVHSVVVAPVAYLNNILGALYVASVGTAPLGLRDLQRASALAAMAAPPLEHLRRAEWLRAENERLQRRAGLFDMVGESKPMEDVRRAIAKTAATDVNVLILGESGTGKELVATAVHRASTRASGPLVVVNCAAITESLLESELFGHEKGAFTGAIAARRGRIEEAHEGTLFLDEIGEMALALQAKLLRALQQREFTRVGGNKPVRVDFRLIAATNRNLEEARKKGTFRDDLYYRLNVVSIQMPSLRERRADIPLLAEFFLARASVRCKRKVTGFSSAAMRLIEHYDWPGNVRELENAVERAVVMSSGDLIEAEDLPESLLEASLGNSSGSTHLGKFHDEVHTFKRKLIQSALERSRGSFAEAARLLGLQVTYLHRLARNLEARPDDADLSSRP